MPMNVLLIDADRANFPPLALMKISAWHKARGDRTYLNNGCSKPDKVYVSCVFTKNAPRVRGVAKMFSCPVEIGGYGVNGAKLSDEIEHIRPDYDLCDFGCSIGFTSRGCIRNCPWCIVPKMEGSLRDHAPISEFLHPDHDTCILLDNAFLDSPRCRQNLEFIRDHELKVDFNQGLDIRSVNEKKARLLADCHYVDWDSKRRCLRFSFDTPEIEPEVRRGIRLLSEAGIPRQHLQFYMLVGFSTTFSQDWHRFEVLRELDAKAFVMKYNGRRDVPILNHFARWVNRRYYRVTDFLGYDYGDSQKVIKSFRQGAGS